MNARREQLSRMMERYLARARAESGGALCLERFASSSTAAALRRRGLVDPMTGGGYTTRLTPDGVRARAEVLDRWGVPCRGCGRVLKEHAAGGHPYEVDLLYVCKTLGG
jgi:hypothetical protein